MDLKKTVQILLLCAVGAVFYYSWLPSPDFSNESYLPTWLVRWSNYYYNLRTALPFLVIGFLVESYTYQGAIVEKEKNVILLYLRNLGFSAIIVCLAEGGQFLIQGRSPDLKDVFFGVLGSIIGALGYHIINELMCNKKIRNAK